VRLTENTHVAERRLSLSDREMMESRVRDINDALQLLSGLVLKGFDDLSIYERISIRYLVIQLVEASASICVRILLGLYNENAFIGWPLKVLFQAI
jgi:hypothetical protein